MEKPDKQIAAEFDAYCAAAKDHAEYNRIIAKWEAAIPQVPGKLIPLKRALRIPIEIKK